MRRTMTAVALLLGMAPAAAQTALPSATFHEARDKLPADVENLVRLDGSALSLAVGSGQAALIDPDKQAIVRRYAIDSAEYLAGRRGLNDRIALLRAADGGRQLVDPMTGDGILALAQDDDVLALSEARSGGIAVVHRGRGDRVALVRIGQATPVAEMAAPAGAGSSTPRAGIADNGASVVLTWGGAARLVDVASGAVRDVQRPAGSPPVVAATFTADDTALILVTESGPLDVRNTKTLEASGRIDVPPVNKRFAAVAHAGGSVVEMEGRRQRVIFDTKTGKAVTAERGSSGSGFLLRFLAPDTVLRAAVPRMGKGASYGTYRYAKGDFKLAFREVLDGLSLGALAPSPNARCLFVVATGTTKIVDTTDNKTLTRVAVSGIAHAVFSASGDAVIASKADGTWLTIESPKRCRGST